jgi:hypothetical protein
MWIRVQGKARGGEKAEHTRQYVSIVSRLATPPWGLRRTCEMGSTSIERKKMKKNWIILKLNCILSSIWTFVSLPAMKYDSSFGPSFCLPFGKADDIPSPALSRVRHSLL